MKVICLLTDFGLKDGFVGCMKGVILSINPEVQIVDLSHEVDSFNILEGALILKAHYKYFPEKTVFICVVDPGVGSERKPLIVKTSDYFFVGPDNGIFDPVLKEEKIEEVRIIENKKFMLEGINNTFHGRDIFAPAGAYITKGVKLKEFGRRIDYTFRLNVPEAIRKENFIEGEIIYFDKFGNAITNIPCGNYKYGEFRGEKIRVVPFFQAGDRDKLNMVCGSFGFMEVFVPLDNAKEKFKIKRGERVRAFF